MKTPSTHSARNTKPNACRDRELVRYVGRHGLVTLAHIMAAMKVGQAITYRRVRRCIDAGLLERHAILCSEGSVIRATREGIQFAGLGLPVASLSPGGVDHYLRCASTAQKLVEEFGIHVYTEPEVALMEAIKESHLLSAKVGGGWKGGPRFHRPDLLAVAFPGSQGEEHRVAVEVELTPKAPRRLREIIRAWRSNADVQEVRYYCREGVTHRAVSAAVKAVKADEVDKIVVIEGVPE